MVTPRLLELLIFVVATVTTYNLEKLPTLFIHLRVVTVGEPEVDLM